jgi:hypothetical protein
MTTPRETFDERATRAATAVREAARDSDIETLLERVEDAHARPWWFVPALVAGAAAATITAILVVPGVLSPDPTPVIAPVGSERASQAPTTPAPGELGRFDEVATFAGSSAALVELPTGDLLSIGWEGRPVVRRSTDGVSWEVLDTDLPSGEVVPVDATLADGEIWMVATTPGGALGFVSRDGVAWEPASFTPAPGEPSRTQASVRAVTAHGRQVVAAGHDDTGAWVAVLSRASSSLAPPAPTWPQLAAETSVLDLASDGDTLVVLTWRPDGDGGRVLVTRGELGSATTWDERALVPGFQTSGTVASTDAGFLVPGTFVASGGAPGWVSSPDGRTWHSRVARDDAPTPMYVDAIDSAGGLVVGLGRDSGTDEPRLLEMAATPDARTVALGSERPWNDRATRFGELARVGVTATRHGFLATVTATTEDGTTTTTVLRHPRSVVLPDESTATTDAPATETPTSEPPASHATACEPTDVDPPAAATDGLSADARETYERILAAAEACDLAELAAIADEGEPVLVSYGQIFLDEEWLRSGRGWIRPADDPLGNPNIVDILRRTLSLPTAVLEPGEGYRYHAWPRGFVELTPDTEEELLASGLYTREELQQFEDFGGFAGWRVLITDDGDWTLFIAGD